jgi:hypothetical protein
MQAKRKHNMKKVIVWETSPSVAGGQKMTLTVMDLLKDDYLFHCLIPGEGTLADELKKRGIPYTLMGDQSMPAGVKGKRVYFQYAWLSLKNIVSSLGAIRRFQPDLLYAPGPASLPWSAVCGALTGKPVIWHLHHLFMEQMSTTPKRYIMEKRLQFAKRELLRGIKATEVAAKCGFTDYSAFFRAYKKQFGHSPAQTGQSDCIRISFSDFLGGYPHE